MAVMDNQAICFGGRLYRSSGMSGVLQRTTDHWWVFALKGVAAIAFAIVAFAWPGLTLAVLVLVWGSYALIDGVLSILAAFRTDQDHRWALVLGGIIGVGAGVATFVWPGLTALVLVYIIAFWALLTGVLELVAAWRLRAAIQNEWWMALGGLATVVFGILLIISPGAGALALVWLIAAYAVVFGIVLLILAFRLRGVRQQIQAHAPA
jgi:uncharacterized membrane protein HdeD (DUF308 family)